MFRNLGYRHEDININVILSYKTQTSTNVSMGPGDERFYVNVAISCFFTSRCISYVNEMHQ